MGGEGLLRSLLVRRNSNTDNITLSLMVFIFNAPPPHTHSERHLRTLLTCVEQSAAPPRNNAALHLAVADEEKNKKQTRMFAGPMARAWRRFVMVAKREHEWLAPFFITVEDRYFTAAARVMLLTMVILMQMFTEALLFDFRFPSSGGTCALSTITEDTALGNVSTTTMYNFTRYNFTNASSVANFTNSSTRGEFVQNGTASTSNFGPAPELTLTDKIGLSCVTAALNVPLAAVCVAAFMKLAMAKKNEHLWERFGIDQLRDTLRTRRRTSPDGVTTTLVSCAGVAFLTKHEPGDSGKESQASVTLTSKTTFDLTLKDGVEHVVLTDSELGTEFTFPAGGGPPRQQNAGPSEACKGWQKALQNAIDTLPRHTHALQGAKAATTGRLRHINRRLRRGHKFGSAADAATLKRLEALSQELAAHASAQLKGVTPRESDNDDTERRKAAEAAAAGSIFRHDDIEFSKALRALMLIDENLTIEEEEDEGGKRLRSCCCRACFQYTVVKERHPISVSGSGLRRGVKWLLFGFMSLWSVACAFYVVLFGFCHGQEATLEWMGVLCSQLIVSALVFRPLTIMAIKAALPAMVIETGLSSAGSDLGSDTNRIAEKGPAKGPAATANAAEVVVEMTSLAASTGRRLAVGTRARLPPFGECTVVAAPRPDDGVVAVELDWTLANGGKARAWVPAGRVRVELE